MGFSFLHFFEWRGKTLHALLCGFQMFSLIVFIQIHHFLLVFIFAVLPLPRYSHAVHGKRLFSF